jgi:hypothetical protein
MYSWRTMTDALRVFFLKFKKKAAATAGEAAGEVAREELSWLSSSKRGARRRGEWGGGHQKGGHRRGCRRRGGHQRRGHR